MKVSTLLVSGLLACASVLSSNLSGIAHNHRLKTVLQPTSNSVAQAFPTSPDPTLAPAAPSVDNSKPASSFPMETPTTPSTRVEAPGVGGATLAAPEDSSKKVLVTCGSSGAASVREAGAVPIGCRVLKTSTPPSAALKN